MFNNLKIIKWEFGTEDIMKSTNLCGKNWGMSKGQWKGLMFSITGLGLTKSERDFFDTKFLQFKNHINIYFFKWVFTYDNRGIEENMYSVDIVYNRLLKYIIRSFVREKKYQLKNKWQQFRDKIERKYKFNKQYNFTMCKAWEGEYSFTSDILSAFQLASNYEADLMLNGKYILSPLGFEWEENNKLVKKYTGRKFGKNLGYKHTFDNEIKNYKQIPYKNIY